MDLLLTSRLVFGPERPLRSQIDQENHMSSGIVTLQSKGLGWVSNQPLPLSNPLYDACLRLRVRTGA